jgi:hypothetical protein
MLLLSMMMMTSEMEAFAPGTSFGLQRTSSSTTSSTAPSSILQMAGMGMGMAPTKSKKKKGGGGGGMSNKKKGGGKNKSSSSSTPFDASKSLLKHEKLYDEICTEAAKALNSEYESTSDTITSEYVIAARSSSIDSSSISSAASVSDWIPVAQLCINRPKPYDGGSESSNPRNDKVVQMAISSYCREISHAATLAAPIFKTLPRNVIQYSVEPIDSFYKFVYDDVIEGKKDSKGKNGKNNDMIMTKTEAREVLDLSEDCNDLSEIKRAYRKGTFKLHPDRFVGVERSEEDVKKTADEFARVKLAYETMSSGIRSTGGSNNGSSQSWYESLGGRSRTDFSGAIELMPLQTANDLMSKKKDEHKCAIAGLTAELAMAFVTRNQAAAM